MQKRILPLNKLIENLEHVVKEWKTLDKNQETVELIEFVIKNLQDYIETTHKQQWNKKD